MARLEVDVVKLLRPTGSGASGDGIAVRPRWPAREVLVSEEVLARVCTAQASLSGQGVRLTLVRGYEAGCPLTRLVRRRMRALGSVVFRLLYPVRASEAPGIFGANGHDDPAGGVVDVAIVVAGRRLPLLPFGVFTPLRIVEAGMRTHQVAIGSVHQALQDAGLSIHPNVVESLQVHCCLAAESQRHSS